MTLTLSTGQVFALGVAAGIVMTIVAIIVIAILAQMKK